MGSTSIVMDASGQIVEKGDYMPWGGERGDEGISTTDYGYTGQMQEGDIYYYGARWYDPDIGRFMQADSIVPMASQGTQAFDRYAYVNNNPMIYVDPSGDFAITTAILIGVGIGALVGYAGQVINNLSKDMSFKEALTTDISPGWIIGGAVAGGVIGGVGFAALSHIGIINATATATTTASGLCADGDCRNEIQASLNSAKSIANSVDTIPNTGRNTVYILEESGVVKYIGITNNYYRRAYEHFLAKGSIIRPVEGLFENLSRSDARAVEQVLIEKYGLTNLENVINSISQHNPKYGISIIRGNEILNRIGFLR